MPNIRNSSPKNRKNIGCNTDRKKPDCTILALARTRFHDDWQGMIAGE